jgi:hypothetical protein
MIPDSQCYFLGLLTSGVDGATFELHAEVHRVTIMLWRLVPEERG